MGTPNTRKRSIDSPPIKLLQHVWTHMQQATGHSWLKINHALADTLALAVKSGMRFHKDDFTRIFREANQGGFRAGYWVGADAEWFYRLAVLYRNASAWQTYEKRAGRKPFIYEGASLHVNTGDGPCGEGLSRLVVGAMFPWKGHTATVTSFKDGSDPYLIACAYTYKGEHQNCDKCHNTINWPKKVLARRFKITHKQLRAAQRRSEKELAQCA